MTTGPRLTLLLAALIVSCGDGTDPNPRLQAAMADSCELQVRCFSGFSGLTVEQCMDDLNLLLSAFHYVDGPKCIHAYIDVAECERSYDCELYEALSRCGGQSSCDVEDPCAHLQEPVGEACTTFDFGGLRMGGQ